MKIKILGLGGVGLYLIDPICRFLSYRNLPERPQVTLVDGDEYTEDNRSRQRFARLGNKAEVTKELLAAEFGDKIHFFAEPVYLDEFNATTLIRNKDVVLCCVDNFTSRKIIGERCQNLVNVLAIAGGNNYTDGSLQIHYRVNSEDVTLPFCNEFHPEVASPKENNHPAYLARMRGCEQEAKTSAQQLVFANFMVASLMCNAFYAFVAGHKPHDEVFFDLVLNMARSERRTPNE